MTTITTQRRSRAGLVAAVLAALGAALLVVPAQAAQARPHWRVTAHASATQVTVGHQVHITGKVARSAAGKLVVLQEKFAPDRPWRVQRNALVHADGTYRTFDTPTINQSRRYRVVMPATKTHRRGVSRVLVVAVYRWQDLTSRPSVNADAIAEVDSVAIDGTTYPASMEAVMDDQGLPTSQSIEFNLDRKCLRFRGTFGLSDDSEATGRAEVSAAADGTSWFDRSFGLGESAHGTVTFASPPLKIRFDTQSLVTGVDGLGAIGSPQVYCTR